MRTPAETCRKMVYPLFALTLSIALAACGGGGASGGSPSGKISPGGQSTPGSALVQGKVSGPIFIAVDNDTNLEAGRSTSAGGLTTFGMTLPTGKSYMFYLLDNGVTGNPSRVLPVYVGPTNVFRITTDANGQTIDLGLVNPDLTGGTATPANDLLECPGVIAGGENRSIPPTRTVWGYRVAPTKYRWSSRTAISIRPGSLFTPATQFQGRLPQVPLPCAEWIQYAQLPDRLGQRPTLPCAWHGGRAPARPGQSDLSRTGLGRASGYRCGFFITSRGQLRSAAKLPGAREHGEHYAL